tara:strand:- start:443 stop:577 length:135 start_codon:yes stop_codon:yes gene_type:complete
MKKLEVAGEILSTREESRCLRIKAQIAFSESVSLAVNCIAISCL